MVTPYDASRRQTRRIMPDPNDNSGDKKRPTPADDATIAAMDTVPEITIWMYPPKKETKRKVLGRTLNIEVATGKVSYAKFAQEYAAKKPTSMMLLQGHCGMWNDDSFRDFAKIAALLKQDGWITLTAAQYAEKIGKK